jgi:hypothetical protein
LLALTFIIIIGVFWQSQERADLVIDLASDRFPGDTRRELGLVFTSATLKSLSNTLWPVVLDTSGGFGLRRMALWDVPKFLLGSHFADQIRNLGSPFVAHT